MKRLTPPWLTVVGVLAALAGAQGQEVPPRGTITLVEFLGLDQTGGTFVRDIAGVRVGDVFEADALDAAVARLQRTGRFLSVTYAVSAEGDGVRVTFTLRERSRISSIQFEGNEKYNDGHLGGKIGIKVGDPVDVFAARDGRDTIIALYRDAGYGDVKVTLDEARLVESGELIYTIVEGQRIRVRKVLFEGNETYPARELARQIETKKAILVFRTGAFDEDKARADDGRLQNYYRDRGYLDAEATHRTQLAPNGKDLTVIFTIKEGIRYGIEAIEIRGQSVFTAEELLGTIQSRVGETIRRPWVDADVRAVQARYGELGYIYSQVRVVRVFSDRPALVRLTFEIKEGEQFRVGRVTVRGNARTKDKVVRRALDLYPPDDWFNLTAAQEAEKRLIESKVFSSAKVIPTGDQPGVRDAVIDVQEAEKAGDFLFGFGVTSNSGLVGSVVLDLLNFDLYDTPRSFSEFFKFRSFYGGGQRLRLELQPGTELSRARIDFTEPYLMDKPLRFDLSLYLFDRDRDGYNEGRIGSSVAFGKKFERGPLHGWSGEIAFVAEDVSVDDLDLFAASDIRDVEGSNLLTSVKGSMLLDRTDSRFVPTRGDRFRVAYEQFMGDHVFGQVTMAYNWFTTLATDVLDRKTVLELRGEGGAIVGSAPVFERFYAGGTGSIRGFEFRGVGERDGIDDNNIGGDYLVLLGAEYSFPLYGENLRGHYFLDTGTAGSGTYRAAIGAGVRLTINFLGPLPIELNLAWPVSSDSDDDEQFFSFLIGRVF